MEQHTDTGIVREILPGNRALVAVKSLGDCAACGAKESCNVFAGKKINSITARYTGEISPGDRVSIEIKAEARITAAVILFVAPLLFLFAGYLISFSLLGKEGPAAVISLISLGISIPCISYLTKKLPILQKMAPHISKINSSLEENNNRE